MENDYNGFISSAKGAADSIKSIDSKETIRIISHLDADGITACAIIAKALNSENKNYVVSIVKQLDEKNIKIFSEEEYNYFIFTDLGSGQIKQIKEFFKGKTVFILDHHEPLRENLPENIMEVNPHLNGYNGGLDISGAGVVYFVAKHMNPANEQLAHLAVIGAIGDVQENNGFHSLNKEILETAKKHGFIEVKKGLKFFGSQTRPLYKVLEYSTDVFIPGITGNENNAINFLVELGINPRFETYRKGSNGWKRLVDLNDDEIARLISGIVMKRVSEEIPEDVLGYNYIIKKEEIGTPFRDAKEYSTLLNSCGRMNKASLGIGVCLNDEVSRKKALGTLMAYKREIVNSIKWFEQARISNGNVHEGKNYVIINAKDKIRPTMIGTLASIIAKRDFYQPGTSIVSMAYDEDTIKISMRIVGKNESDLREDINKILIIMGYGVSGGHCNAAGALIPKEKEEEFIAAVKKYFEN